MAKKTTGQLIKEARTSAGMTQEQLAKKVKGLAATDISKAERGEMYPTTEQLKEIAKATGVTQKSLLDSVPASKKNTSTAKKTTSSKTSTAKKTTPTSKKTTSSKSSTSKSSSGDMKLTAAEKTLVELYRAADTETKKAATKLLKEQKSDMEKMLTSVLNNKDIKKAVSTFLK